MNPYASPDRIAFNKDSSLSLSKILYIFVFGRSHSYLRKYFHSHSRITVNTPLDSMKFFLLSHIIRFEVAFSILESGTQHPG